jgi:hypothetical protein
MRRGNGWKRITLMAGALITLATAAAAEVDWTPPDLGPFAPE